MKIAKLKLTRLSDGSGIDLTDVKHVLIESYGKEAEAGRFVTCIQLHFYSGGLLHLEVSGATPEEARSKAFAEADMLIEERNRLVTGSEPQSLPEQAKPIHLAVMLEGGAVTDFFSDQPERLNKALKITLVDLDAQTSAPLYELPTGEVVNASIHLASEPFFELSSLVAAIEGPVPAGPGE